MIIDINLKKKKKTKFSLCYLMYYLYGSFKQYSLIMVMQYPNSQLCTQGELTQVL